MRLDSDNNSSISWFENPPLQCTTPPTMVGGFAFRNRRELARPHAKAKLAGSLLIKRPYYLQHLKSMSRNVFIPFSIVLLVTAGKVKAQEKNNKDTLTYYRTQIDTLDKQIIDLLGQRMTAARAIGIYKMNHKMNVVQSARFEEILLNAIKRGNQLHLSEEFIRALYNDIHKESIYQQEQLRPKK